MEVKQNINETVPFLFASNMEKTLYFYVNSLGFEIQQQWIPTDRIMWCKIKKDNGSLMLQEHHSMANGIIEGAGKVGIGVFIYFICEDALKIYKGMIEKGIDASEPFVGNNMWVTSVKDPDGYSIYFDSVTDVAEGTRFSEWAK